MFDSGHGEFIYQPLVSIVHEARFELDNVAALQHCSILLVEEFESLKSGTRRALRFAVFEKQKKE